MKKKTILALAIALTSMVLLVWQCNFQELEDPLSAVNFKITEMTSLSTPIRGQTSTFYNYETIMVSLDQLYPQMQTRICVIKRATNSIIKCLLVISDENGQIRNLPVWYHVGVNDLGQRVDDSGDYYLHVLQIHYRGIKNNFKIPFKVINSYPPHATIWPSTGEGDFNGGAALVGTPVYASGAGFAANAEVRLYLVKKPTQYAIGDLFNDESGGYETVTTTAAGMIPPTQIWNAATLGEYDLVADIDPFGQYNLGDAINNPMLPGLIVQNPPSTADVIQDIACDAQGHYTNQFNGTDAIYAQVWPKQQPNVHQQDVHLYLTFHKDLWKAGDPLVAIPTAGNLNGPIQCLLNQSNGALLLTQLRTQSSASAPPPVKLWPGRYDVILDVNTNGAYDPGVDILDGGSQPGFTVPGTPGYRFVFSWQPFTCDCGNDTRHLMLLTVDANENPLSGISVVFKLDKNIGTLAITQTKTDNFGIAHTIFYGGPMGDWSQVAAYPTSLPGGGGAKMYLWGELCYTHNQGIIIGG